MNKKSRFVMVLVLVTGLLSGLMTASTVSADPSPGTRIQIPRIDFGDVFGAGTSWATKLQIQNLSSTSWTWAAVCYWEAYSGECSSSTLLTWHKRYIPPHGVWTLTPPYDAQSAIVWSLKYEPTSCPGAYTYLTRGGDIAVTVDRWGLDADGLKLSSSYVGISEDMEGSNNQYFAPYVMYNYLDALDTTIAIQNSGRYCTSAWIYYKQEDNCEYQVAQHIEAIAPGETIRVGPGGDVAFPSAVTDPGLNPNGWLGSAYISANKPLGIIVDQWSYQAMNNQATLLTYRGRPYDQTETTYYADLLYREVSGWTSSIQVQNLTRDSMPTFVTVDFMDQSGNHILFVGDWICRNGSATFYLPALVDLGHNYPFGYVGAAEIRSSQQVDYPGQHHPNGEPIFAVVDIKKTTMWDPDLRIWRPTHAGETQGGAYNAHPEDQKLNVSGIALPFIARKSNGVTSKIAIRNNSNYNKIKGTIHIKDETGVTVAYIPVPWLHPKHLKVFDLANFGQIVSGFVGAAEFLITVPGDVEQLCDTDLDGQVNAEPLMPSAVVLNYGWEYEIPAPGEDRKPPLATEGDLCRIYEGIPFDTTPMPCYGSLFGTVTVKQNAHGYDREEIGGVTVTVGDLSDDTDSTGGYQILNVLAATDVAVTFTKDDFFPGTVSPVTVECGKEKMVNCELVCSNMLAVTVLQDDEDSNPIPGASVNISDGYGTRSGTTGADGKVSIKIAGATTPTGSASATGYDNDTSIAMGTPNTDCLSEPTATFALCRHSTVIGIATIGGQAAEGYTMKSFLTATWAEVDSSLVTAGGVFSLNGFSKKTYFLRLYNGDQIIDTSDNYTFSTCGETRTINYTNGSWTAP